MLILIALLLLQSTLTDTGRRLVHFIAYDGNIYAFVYMHADDSRNGRAYGAWHGDCFLRLET